MSARAIIERLSLRPAVRAPSGTNHVRVEVSAKAAKRYESGPEFKTLNKNKVKLTDEERAEVMKGGAVWHFSSHNKPSAAVWKSVVNGKTYYGCNTHRCFQTRGTLKAAIRAFHDVVEPTA